MPRALLQPAKPAFGCYHPDPPRLIAGQTADVFIRQTAVHAMHEKLPLPHANQSTTARSHPKIVFAVLQQAHDTAGRGNHVLEFALRVTKQSLAYRADPKPIV